MTQPTIQEPVAALPPSLPPQLSPRQIARARRRQAAARAWREYRRSWEGMIGLGILVVFVAVAVFVPLFVPSSALDVTRATRAPFLPPSGQFPSGPTRAAARCWPWSCGGRGCRCWSGSWPR